MKRKNIFYSLAILLTSVSTMAGMGRTFRIEGVVDSIKHDEITLWVRGKLVTVTRVSIPAGYKVIPGEHVEAYVPSETLVATTKKIR